MGWIAVLLPFAAYVGVTALGLYLLKPRKK